VNREVVHDGKGAFQVRFGFERRLVDRIKSLPNRRWNASDRLWLVPEDDVLPLVELLADDRFRFCATTVRLYLERGGRLAVSAAAGDLFADFEEVAADEVDPAPAPSTDWTVSRLNQRVRDILLDALPTKTVTGTVPPEVTGIADDSRKVERGQCFVAVPGLRQDARRFVPAVARPRIAGARASPSLRDDPEW